MGGPGRALLDALCEALGGLLIAAEDLGHITPDVEELVAELGLPGMRVAQFGFGEPASLYPIDRGGAPLGRVHGDPRQRHDRRLA